MAKRKRIGLLFESYNSMPAYVIYIINMVKTLNLVEDKIKPHLVILHKPDSPIIEIKDIKYPYIEFYELQDIYKNPFKRVINKIWRKILKKNLLPFRDNGFPDNLDVMFPYGERPECIYIKDKIIWKADFQEYHLPIYFDKKEFGENHKLLKETVQSKIKLVLSSEDAKRDFIKFFPNNKVEIHLLKFTSYLPKLDNINVLNLTKKYGLDSNYFVVSNQFWPHKNHLTVLKALKLSLEQQELNFKILFTGKTTSARDPELYDKLQFYIQNHSLENHVVFTGFISREEQLCLMKNSLAVIQPSLFEGWSTVDRKSVV